MPYLKLLFPILILLLTRVEALAQRSLYQDALELSDRRYSFKDTVTFHFSQPENIRFRASNSEGDLRQASNFRIPRTFEEDNFYTFVIQGQVPGDRVEFKLKDTTVQLVWSDEMFGLPDGRWVIVYHLDVSTNSRVTIQNNYDFFYKRSLQDTTVLSSSSILLDHEVVQLLQEDTSSAIGYWDLIDLYSANPFLANQFTENSPELSVASTLDHYNKIKEDNFIDQYYKRYPYQKIIEGDSLLDFRKKLLITNTTASYRNQIVTAQTQLIDASAEIDQQRQRSQFLDANTVAVGLSDFIAERAQEELNLTFFNRFKENMEQESELTKLFPETRRLLYQFEISNYKTFLTHARETFENDLDNLGLNLPTILDLPKYQSFANDPNLFNLTLIYSIADLAYRDEPVDNILLASLQRVRQRNDYLDKSINLAITDSIFSQFPDVYAAESPLASYRSAMLDYLNNVCTFHQDYSSIADSVEELLQLELSNLGPRGNTPFVQKLSNLLYYLKTARSSMERHAYLDYGYERAKAIQEPLAYARDFISATLSGNDYHAFRLNAEVREDFENYYLLNPLPPKEYVVRGIAASRNFLDFGVEGRMQQASETLQKAFNEIIPAKIAYEEKALTTADELIQRSRNIETGYEHLRSAITWEIDFWKKATGRDEQDHYIGGMVFLKNLHERSNSSFVPRMPAWWLEEEEEIPAFEIDHEYETVEAGTLRMDTLWQKVRLQRQRLIAVFGQQPGQENPYFTQYEQALQQQTREVTVDTTMIVKFRKEVMEPLHERVAQMMQQREQLDAMLHDMYDSYASQLIETRQSTQNLATTMELSAHLLFAFRNYDSAPVPLYYQDTIPIEVTVQLPPAPDGFVQTFTKDSMTIVQQRIPEKGAKTKSGRWITPSEFDRLKNDEYAWNIFLSLLYQRLHAVDDAYSFDAQGMALLATKFLNLVIDIEQQSQALRFKKATQSSSLSFRDYYPFIRSSVDLFNTVINTPVIGPERHRLADLHEDLGRVTTISDESLSLYENIFVKEYGNAILNATELMKILTHQDTPPENKLAEKARTRNLRGINAVFRYGSFMASMLDAQTSEQVKAILKSTTLPPGSSRIKREVVSSFTVNSYLGIAGGRDYLLNAPTGLEASALGAALSVPIGLTYSFSPSFLKNSSSFSIHVPMLDLGAITAYRSNPDGNTVDINNLPELEWKNLFSPGAYIIYNFANSPFSVGFGGQYGPQLRQLDQASGTPTFVNSARFPMGFFSVDVPFYNLHTGARKITVR